MANSLHCILQQIFRKEAQRPIISTIVSARSSILSLSDHLPVEMQKISLKLLSHEGLITHALAGFIVLGGLCPPAGGGGGGGAMGGGGGGGIP